jgi:hypothetical protein
LAIPGVSASKRMLATTAAPFHPSEVVLGEQLAALKTLGRTGRTSSASNLPISMRGRSRLVELAIELLAHAAQAAEAECRAIVQAAETQGAAIVQKAHEDVDRISTWLDAESGAPTLETAAESEDQPAAVAPPAVAAQLQEPSPFADPDSAAGNQFFDSPSDSDLDPWGFMDDDDLVGVGPSIMKLVRRRPSLPRPQPAS